MNTYRGPFDESSCTYFAVTRNGSVVGLAACYQINDSYGYHQSFDGPAEGLKHQKLSGRPEAVTKALEWILDDLDEPTATDLVAHVEGQAHRKAHLHSHGVGST